MDGTKENVNWTLGEWMGEWKKWWIDEWKEGGY